MQLPVLRKANIRASPQSQCRRRWLCHRGREFGKLRVGAFEVGSTGDIEASDHLRSHGRRKDIFRGGGNSGFSLKFHFTLSKLRK